MQFTSDDVAKAKELTISAMKEYGLMSLVENSDLDYITVELLQEYATAQDKDLAHCDVRDKDFDKSLMDEEITQEELPCYIGHSAVYEGNAMWVYKNNNPSDGCDLNVHLCGTGNSWRAKCSKYMKDRYCSNGYNGFLGWP